VLDCVCATPPNALTIHSARAVAGHNRIRSANLKRITQFDREGNGHTGIVVHQVAVRIVIEVELDVEPRVIEIPKDLMQELKKDKEAKAIFDKLSYTHQKEYVRWVEEAKKEETRQNRIVKTIEMLKKGKRGV